MLRVLLWALAVVSARAWFVRTNAEACAVLMDFYNSTQGDNWLEREGWGQGDCCGHPPWFGVTCEGGNVTQLNLLSNHLVGHLPPSLWTLPHLAVLQLADNDLEGQLVFPILPDRGVLPLRAINISNNGFTGPFPANLQSLVNLQEFRGYLNSFSGPLPLSFPQLSSLWMFHMNCNQFTGTVPSSIVSMSNLQVFGVGQNLFRGPFPMVHRNLGFLDIGDNQFTGPFPFFGENSSLYFLYAGHNHFSGPIGQFPPGMITLYLLHNEFTGTLPHSLQNYSQLELLDVSSNQLYGTPPAFLFDSRMPKLTKLSLQDNAFEGDLSDLMSRLNPQLSFLDVSHNRFHVGVDSWELNIPGIVQLNVSHNPLSTTLLHVLAGTLGLIDISATQLLCPLPDLVGVSLAVDAWLPCKLDTTLLLVETIILPLWLLFLMLVILIFKWRSGRHLCELEPWERKAWFWAGFVSRTVSYGLMLKFVEFAFTNLRLLQAVTPVCDPVNYRRLFEFKLKWILQYSMPDNTTFQQYMDVFSVGLEYEHPIIQSQLHSFRDLCGNVNGCEVAPDQRWLRCVSGAPRGLPGMGSPENLWWLLVGLMLIVAFLEGFKATLLVLAWCRRKEVPEGWRYFVASSPFVVAALPWGFSPLVLHRPSPKDKWWRFFYGTLLFSLPLAALNVYFCLFAVRTSLDALATASLPLSLLTSFFALFIASQATCCSRRHLKGRCGCCERNPLTDSASLEEQLTRSSSLN